MHQVHVFAGRTNTLLHRHRSRLHGPLRFQATRASTPDLDADCESCVSPDSPNLSIRRRNIVCIFLRQILIWKCAKPSESVRSAVKTHAATGFDDRVQNVLRVQNAVSWVQKWAIFTKRRSGGIMAAVCLFWQSRIREAQTRFLYCA